MELSLRIKYFTFLILGVMFIVTGIALNELDILAEITRGDFDAWYDFLAPWVGSSERPNSQLPVPWDQ
ncbi:MAG: hypothetical protein ACXAE3_01150 [Candidatus Kariarchaeaceae archaeon]|jgi:hypothetical protein